jgi:excisionase family DNA binding protein
LSPLTTKEAAQRLNYDSDASIRKLIQRKQLKAEKLGKVWAIPVEELGKIKWIRKQYKKKTS